MTKRLERKSSHTLCVSDILAMVYLLLKSNVRNHKTIRDNVSVEQLSAELCSAPNEHDEWPDHKYGRVD